MHDGAQYRAKLHIFPLVFLSLFAFRINECFRKNDADLFDINSIVPRLIRIFSQKTELSG